MHSIKNKIQNQQQPNMSQQKGGEQHGRAQPGSEEAGRAQPGREQAEAAPIERLKTSSKKYIISRQKAQDSAALEKLKKQIEPKKESD